MATEQHQEYDDALVSLLQLVWGDGFLSPGGPDEVRLIVEPVDLAGKRVLDIGCGTGGVTKFIAETFAPEIVFGIDVDSGLIARAKIRAHHDKPGGNLHFKHVRPGSLPFGDGQFDVVFSKDSLLHIENKEALFADIFRVLAPGGVVAASDWMSGTEPPFSPQMAYYIEAEDLGFGMASPGRYRDAMAAAGFTDIVMTDRNDWYKPIVAREYETLSGSHYSQLIEMVGKDFADQQVEVWRALLVVVESGELRPTHLYGRKPD